jgi:hypothetical protein
MNKNKNVKEKESKNEKWKNLHYKSTKINDLYLYLQLHYLYILK